MIDDQKVDLANELVGPAVSLRENVVNLGVDALFLQGGGQISRGGIVALAERGGQNENGFQSHFFRLKKMNIPTTEIRQTTQKYRYPNGQLSSGMFHFSSVLKFMP